MAWNLQDKIADIVREDYRAADVFKQYGINYCCGGNVPLEEACTTRNIDPEKVLDSIRVATRTINLPSNIQFNKWKLDFLIDYIVNIHHAYLYDSLPTMELMLVSFVTSHKNQYPGLAGVSEAFRTLNTTISAEMKKQEESVFPYIKQIDNAWRRKESYGKLFVRTLSKPLKSLNGQRDEVADIVKMLRKETNDYHFPDKACTNHQVIYQKLQEMDNDIMQHKHLENNVLFPKVYAMEQELLNL